MIRKASIKTTRAVKRIVLTARKFALGYCFMMLRNCIATDPGKVFFFTFQNECTCNPKYIYQELVNCWNEKQVYWSVNNKNKADLLPEGVIPVKTGSFAYYRALYSSAIWIDNALDVQKLPVKRKTDQYYLQTMHGSLGIKRIGTNATPTKKQKKRELKSRKLTSVAISNSTFETEVYQNSFWRGAEVITAENAEEIRKNPEKCYIMELGHARNDILIRARLDAQLTKRIREKVCNWFGVASEIKLLLWAPTFEDSTKKLCEPDLSAFCEALEKRFGGKWMAICRLHPRDKIKLKSDLYLDGGQYPDIQELMVAADFAITNYSSWIFDYLLTEKPGMLFVPDLEYYADSTGFYYPITSTPFPVVEDNDTAVKAIEAFDLAHYQEQISGFIQSKGCVDDGNAARRIVDLIKMLLE